MSEETQSHTFNSSGKTAAPVPTANVTSDNKPVEEITRDVKGYHQKIDDDSAFWDTYVRQAGKYDAELLESWNESLSSLLLFAALFSAINTAFIIEIQKGLQADPIDTTNHLLRLLIKHRNDSVYIDDTALVPQWAAESSALRLNAIFFASLSLSLIASFGAILGKEMLSEYKVSGALNSPAEQGQIRQQKFDGLRNFHFRFLMHLLPVLLQMSLALFLFGLVDFLSHMSMTVAIVMAVPVVLGLFAYIVSLATALRYIHSPFQTSVSKGIKLLFSSVRILRSSVERYARDLKTYFPPAPPQVTIGHPQQAISLWNRFGELVSRGLQKISIYWSGLGLPFGKGLKKAKNCRESPSYKEMKQDAVKAACVSWLIEQAGDSQVQEQALAAVPLLPAEIIQPLFDQRGIMHRCIFLYQSNLHRRPSQVKYTPDETQTRIAILAGTAIFHVLKSRDEGDQTRKILNVDGDPDIFDIVQNPDRIDELNFLLLTVIHCVQSQVGVTEWDVNLLLRLLQKCSSLKPSIPIKNAPIRTGEFTLRQPSPTTATLTLHTQTHDSSSHSSAAQDISSVTLLLDSILYCVSQRNSKNRHQMILSICGSQFEEILLTLPKILETRTSMMLASHAAVVVSATQWYKAANDVSFHEISYEAIRCAWLAVDKSARFHNNIVLAFKLVGDNPSLATTKVYLSLMRLMVRFHPPSMSVSWKNGVEWDNWWLEVIEIIPCIFRIFDHVHNDNRFDDDNRLSATETSLRIIAQIIPDDWMKDIKNHEHPNQLEDLRDELHCIDPLDRDHGKIAISLMAYFLNTPALQDCRSTRIAAAEVLGWMITLYQQQDGPELFSIITDPNGMYHQATSVPSFLLSILKDPKADMILRRFMQDQFDVLLDLPTGPDGSVSATQLEAFVITVTSFQEFLEPAKIVGGIRRSLEKMTNGRGNSLWPDSFVAAGIVTHDLSPSTTNHRMLRLVEDEAKLIENDDVRVLWMGTALVIAWTLFVKDPQGTTSGHFSIFDHDAVLVVLDCFDRALKTGYQIPFSPFDDFLDWAGENGKVSDQSKERVATTRTKLRSSLDNEWDWLVIQRHGQDTPPI